MNHLCRILVPLFVLAGFLDGETPVLSLSPPKNPDVLRRLSSAPQQERNREWKEYTHEKGKFTVLVPVTPQELTQEVPTAAGKLYLTIIIAELPAEAKVFAVSFGDYPPGPAYDDEAVAHKVIDNVLAGVAQSCKGQIKKKSKIKLGSHHGQECLIDVPVRENQRLLRVYLVGNRLIQLISDWSPKKGGDSKDAYKFMDSFKLTE